MKIEQEGNVIHVTRPDDTKENRSLHGLTRTLLHNMVVGVHETYKKELEINGAPVLPTLRRMTSSTYLMPLPL